MQLLLLKHEIGYFCWYDSIQTGPAAIIDIFGHLRLAKTLITQRSQDLRVQILQTNPLQD